MAQPTPYTPVHTFVSDSATLANFPGQQLDVEFNDIKATTDQIRVNLARIQRDDGAVANSVIGYDQLSPSLQSSGIAPANAWVTGTAYLVGTPVVQAGTLYRCVVSHTSGVFATDLAAGDWVFVATLTVAFTAGSNLSLIANVFSVISSPSFVTPNLNVATATSVNKVAITAPAAGATLTIADGKTLTASNTLTFAGSDGSTVNLASGGNVVYTTNKLSDLAATTSAQLASVLSDETGSGLAVFNTSPTLVTPILGVAAATSVNKVALTAPATGSTLTILDGKTLTANNSLTLAGTDSTVQTFPSTSGTVVSSVSVNAVTNAMAAQMAAYTLKGNSTGSLANVSDIDVTALTLKASPVSGDIVLIQDSAASNAFKKTTVGALASAGSVSSINGITGAVLYGTVAPQGRLSLVSGTDVFTTDQTGITSIWYAPSVGGLVPIFNGTNFQYYSFISGPTDVIGQVIVLGSNWLAATIYDCFIALNGGVPTLCTGPAWSVSTPGSAARGSGAGTTQLAKIGGIQTNAVAMTARSANATTFAVAANQGTYVGSFLTNGSTGTIDFKFGTAASGGGAAVISVYNPYNQVLQIAKVLDTGVTYAYTSAAYQQARASAGNQATVLLGASGSAVEATVYATSSNSTGGIISFAGIGVNATNANSASFQHPAENTVGNVGNTLAKYAGSPGTGLHVLSRLEFSNAAGTTTWYGGTVPGIQPGLEVKLFN